MDKMRRQMEEEIRAQLTANQQMLSDQEQTWDEKVCLFVCLFVYLSITAKKNILGNT